jgi:Na+-driven multidrug efflux pump
MNAAPLGAALTLFFISPAWILSHVLPAGTDTSWALYDESFRRWLLLPLIALMAVRLLLLGAVALNEPWRKPTEVVRFGLWVGFVVSLYWAVFGGRIFAHVITDALFRAWLLIFLLINTIQIVVWIRRTVTRVRIPTALPPPQE